jgi:pimeloyl-ACP methyl ester carboxylesterase
MADLREVLGAVGRAAARGGVFVGRQVERGVRAVDPDVLRHLGHLPLMTFSLLSPRQCEVEAGEPDGFPPLVFVHGLGGSRGDFLLAAGAMRLFGRRRGYRVHLGGLPGLDAMAGALADHVRQVLEATGEERVDLVAHSLGGLVARAALADHGLEGSVDTLVTLGTPHHGTYSARLANTALARDLRPGSAVIRRLEATPLPPGLRAVTFWSDNDLLVIPPESARLDGAEAVDATPATHYSYLLAPHVLSDLGRVLQGTAPVPGPEEAPAGSPPGGS